MDREGFLKAVKKENWIVSEGFSIRLTNGEYLFVENGAWEQGKDLIKQIGAHDVEHATRVVGYMSKVENWNKSKIGELKDRHKGNYGVKK